MLKLLNIEKIKNNFFFIASNLLVFLFCLEKNLWARKKHL
ncbi:hypothetical protein CP10881SC42_0979 [Chlamydia avium]|uniref:Lipoprotein n=1 Tax=Chlamydia avium TaxID=1457141 RepID=A0ABN0MRQ4_9CHLA|nr:hypothetical protein CP10743SC13_0900 [Chlamydia psittaci 10_743_SC13]EPP38132.1 hypothetical protein CP10881SC42_0979 [Chlamydia avium]